MKPIVLVVTEIHPSFKENLEIAGYDVVTLIGAREQNGFDEALAQCVGIITSNKLYITAGIIDAAPHLKWIGRMGSGMEIIDVAYASERGISCFSSPEGNANAVAEQALGMLLCLQHNILNGHLEVKEHQWNRDKNRGWEIEGQTVGIIGYGHNGSALGKKLQALGLNVLCYDKYHKDFIQEGIIDCSDLQPIFYQAQIISFHVPLNEETTHYFDESFLESMKNPFVLLNLSRGPVVSLDALHKGMKNGKIKGAALDVWEKEPFWKLSEDLTEKADELMNMPNFIGTPHIGGYSFDAIYKMSKSLERKILG